MNYVPICLSAKQITVAKDTPDFAETTNIKALVGSKKTVQKPNGENLLLVQILASHFKEVGDLKQELSELKLKVEKIENKIKTQSESVSDVEKGNKTDKDTLKESTNQEEIL